MFHVATLIPTLASDPSCHNKKLHIGNDFVTLVYNDSRRPYEFGTIKVDQTTLALSSPPLLPSPPHPLLPSPSPPLPPPPGPVLLCGGGGRATGWLHEQGYRGNKEGAGGRGSWSLFLVQPLVASTGQTEGPTGQRKAQLPPRDCVTVAVDFRSTTSSSSI